MPPLSLDDDSSTGINNTSHAVDQGPDCLTKLELGVRVGMLPAFPSSTDVSCANTVKGKDTDKDIIALRSNLFATHPPLNKTDSSGSRSISRTRNSTTRLLKSFHEGPHRLPSSYSSHSSYSRTVRFESTVMEHAIPNLEDYTKEEIRATWYTYDELQGIAVAVMKLMKKHPMNNGSKNMDNNNISHINMRGLEDHIVRERREQQQYNRMAATYVVLQEQYKDWSCVSVSIGDDKTIHQKHQCLQQRQKRISHAYQYVVQRCHCIEYAIEMASIDSYEANLVNDDWKQARAMKEKHNNCFELFSVLLKIFK